MAYTTSNEFVARYGKPVYIRLFAHKEVPTDPEPTDADAEAKFALILADVESEIDGYLRRRYALPLATVPADLRSRCLRMIHYYGHLDRKTVTEPTRKDMEDIRGWLRDVAAGKVDLGIAPEPVANSDRSAEVTADERVLTRSNLSGVI